MPVLIDGYNLYHFAKSVYQEDRIELSVSAFCQIIDEWSLRSRQKVRMVFDGGVPPALRQNATHFGSIDLEFTGPKSDADTVIETHMLKSTAPKLLTVVSSDHRIRKTAKRRHCKVVTSDEFWVKVAKKLTAKRVKPEPREKSSGIPAYEREYWLKIFGLK